MYTIINCLHETNKFKDTANILHPGSDFKYRVP